MKTTTFLRTGLAIGLMIISVGVMAQGRGRGNGHGNGNGNGNHGRGNEYKHDRGNHYGHYKQKNYHDDHHHDYRHHAPVRKIYVHHRHRPAPTRVVYVERPARYVYYRDYDVYYDCHRHVYISLSGRHWTVSTSLPMIMHRVDMTRVVQYQVDDYYDDDFAGFLEAERPNGRLYAEW